jgi:WD40 repeat protein
LLQAGLLPFLEQEAVGYRLLRDRAPLEEAVAEPDYPILLLRATGDLAGQIADALCDFCSQPLAYTTPTGRSVTVDLPALLAEMVGEGAARTAFQEGTAAAEPAERAAAAPRSVWTALNEDSSLLARLLDALMQRLPFELVIAIDQGEELITEVREPVEVARRQQALEMLRQLSESPASCKLILTLRTEYLARLLGTEKPRAWREFYLEEPSAEQLVEALVAPTSQEPGPYSDEVPHQRYGFIFDAGLAQDIAVKALEAGRRHQTSPSAWAHAVAALLYERHQRQRRGVLRAADLKLVGSKNALTRALEARLLTLGLTRRQQKDLLALIAALTTRHPSGGPTLDLVEAKGDLHVRWQGTGQVEPLVNRAAGAAGLFAIQQLFIGGQSVPYVSVAHEAVADSAALLQDEWRRTAYGRARVLDTLWIMIPLAFLAAAVTFYIMRQNAGLPPGPVAQHTQELAVQIQDSQMPLYKGLISQAEQALRSGNVLSARQALLNLPARGSIAPVPLSEFPFVQFERVDLRGFDWRYLWKQANSERHRFEGHLMRVETIAVSPDGRLAASGGLDGNIKVWNLARGLIVANLTAPAQVHSVVFTPDGKTLASAGGDRVVRLWDVGGLNDDFTVVKKETKSLTGHEGQVHALACSRDGILASGGFDKSILLWDLATGDKKATLKGEQEMVLALAFNPEGSTLASAGAGSGVVLWDVAGAKKKNTLKTAYGNIQSLAFEPDGKTFTTGGNESRAGTEQGLVRFWDAGTGKETRTPLAHGMEVFGLAYHPDGKSLASVGRDRHVRLWDLASGRERARWDGSLGWLRAVAFTPDGNAVIAGGYDRIVRAWDTAQSSGPQVLEGHGDWVLSLALGDNDKILASGSRDGQVRLWEAATGKALGELPRQAGGVTALSFLTPKDKPLLLAVATWGAGDSGELKLWELTRDKGSLQAKEVKTLEGHTKGVSALAVREGKILASGDAGGTAIVWDLASGKPTLTLQGDEKGHRGPIRGLAFAQKGLLLLTTGHDGTVRFWDTTSGRPVSRPLSAHSAPVEALAVLDALDAQMKLRVYFATGGQDQSVKLWRLPAAGEEGAPDLLQSSQAHAQSVAAVALHSGLIASGSWDQTIKLWDLAGNERLTLLGSSGAVRALIASADLSLLASAGNDGKVRLWRAAPDEPRRKVTESPRDVE